MDSKTQKAVRGALLGLVDSVRITKAGEVIARRGYFYRVQAGGSPEAFAESVAKALRGAGLRPACCKARDRWAPWPRDSYFEVTLTVEPKVRFCSAPHGEDGCPGHDEVQS